MESDCPDLPNCLDLPDCPDLPKCPVSIYWTGQFTQLQRLTQMTGSACINLTNRTSGCMRLLGFGWLECSLPDMICVLNMALSDVRTRRSDWMRSLEETWRIQTTRGQMKDSDKPSCPDHPENPVVGGHWLLSQKTLG